MPDYDGQTGAGQAGGGPATRRLEREMVAANLRLVVHWARRYKDRGVDMTDLVQEGTFGLIRAVEKFDWSAGSASQPTPRGGSARRSRERSNSTAGSSGCHSRSANGSSAWRVLQPS